MKNNIIIGYGHSMGIKSIRLSRNSLKNNGLFCTKKGARQFAHALRKAGFHVVRKGNNVGVYTKYGFRTVIPWWTYEVNKNVAKEYGL